MDRQPIFFYDLGSPQCYIVAETVMAALPIVPEWEPVLAAEIAPGHTDVDRAEIESRAASLGLQPVRWPPRWPPETEAAMLAATYAKLIGRAVAFSLAAYRQAFAGGRDLGARDTILIAGAACEMHPTALGKGIELRSTRQALQTATRRARDAKVTTLPAIQVGDKTYQGLDALADAATALNGAPR
ncbi:MAG: DsbA family protein [Solirubrobacterales bacterium]|nr:DsbA family protein [Solirubrobacterales bacterium]